MDASHPLASRYHCNVTLNLRARAAVHARHSDIAGHTRAVTPDPAGLAAARVISHGVGVTSGGHFVALAVTGARLLVAVVDCTTHTAAIKVPKPSQSRKQLTVKISQNISVRW